MQRRVRRLTRPDAPSPAAAWLLPFLQHLRAAGCAERTVDAYPRDVLAFAMALGATPDTASRDDVRRHLAQLVRRGQSPRTVARRLAAVRRHARFCIDVGTRTSDPTLGLRAPKRARTLPRHLDEAAALRLLDIPDPRTAAGRRDRAILELLYGTGMRLGELVGLDRDDVQPDQETLRVLGKGNKERQLPLTGSVRRAVVGYLAAAKAVGAHLDRT